MKLFMDLNKLVKLNTITLRFWKYVSLILVQKLF